MNGRVIKEVYGVERGEGGVFMVIWRDQMGMDRFTDIEASSPEEAVELLIEEYEGESD